MQAVMEKTAMLPQGWKVAQLGDVLSDIIGGGTPSRNVERYWNGDIPWITVKDMRTRRPELIQEHITRAGVDECATNIIPADTVITATRVGLGKVVRVPYPAAINQDLKALIVGPKLDKSYLEWWIIGNADFIDSIGSGTTVKGIRLNQLRELEIPLAPLPEQRRIVEAIELQLGRLDAAVARLHAAKAKLKRYRQAVLKAAYDQFEKRPLEELTTVITKGASPSWQGVKYVDDPGQTLFVTSENVREGYLDLSVPKYVQNSFNEIQKRSVLKNGDVLLNIVGASIGRAAIYDRHVLANTNQAVCLIRTTDELDNGFLCNYLNSEEAKAYYSRNQVDVARANLSLKDVRELPVPYVPIEEQRTFNDEITQSLAAANNMDTTLDTQLAQSKRLRQSVLKRAFEGRLV